MSCSTCHGFGFCWGGLLHSPQLRRCACSGGPPNRWPVQPAFEASSPTTQTDERKPRTLGNRTGGEGKRKRKGVA